MNPLNNTQLPQTTPQPQFFVTGMPPLASGASILKSSVSPVVSSATQQQPTLVTTINSLGSGTGNNVMDPSKYVTGGTNYMPVLLNQTIISSIDPIKYQQQQHPPNIVGLARGSSTSNANISILSGNASKQLVINSSNPTSNNVTYQFLPATQNNLTPVITAPSGAVSVLLAPTQQISANGHVIIRNTPITATTDNTVQITQQTQLPARQQQHQQFNSFNPQAMSAEVLKQIVVGNPGAGNTTILAPGTTLLKPTILQNNPFIQQKQQAIVKNTKMMISTIPQNQQQNQMQQKHNHTIITTTSENSSHMLAALGAEVVKPSNAANTVVQKLSQVSLLQNSTKKLSHFSELNHETVLKNPNEIKVGNLNSEVSLIKKPNALSIENKSKESVLLKKSNKFQDESIDFETSVKHIIKDHIIKKDSLLKSQKDIKMVNSDNNDIINKSSNGQFEKQTSLLKPQICGTKTESSGETNEQQNFTSPRSQRSKSYSTQEITSSTTSTANNERRHSEPSKLDLEDDANMIETITEDNQTSPKGKQLKSQDPEIFFEDEEYLESSGDKSPGSYNSCNKNLIFGEEYHDMPKLIPDGIEQQTNPSNQIEATNNSKENHKKSTIDTQEKETMNSLNDNKPQLQKGNAEDNSSEDEVMILSTEEVEIEQIEIDDDDDDDEIEKNIPLTEIRPPSMDKEQINESLLCNEQLIISSSSSISNNSSDQYSTTTSASLKAPRIDNATAAPLLKKTLMEHKALNLKEESKLSSYSSALEVLSNFNMLNWRERIGTARGTNLKFQLNEFNLLQLYEKNMSNKRIHTAYEKPICERESSHKRNEYSEPPTYYMCRRCNVQGPSVDFLAPEFCSLSCIKRDNRKRRIETASLSHKRNRVSNLSSNKTINTNYAKETSSRNNIPPLRYNRNCEFSYKTPNNNNYGTMTTPINLFLNPYPTGPNHFSVGMKIEAIDPENCSLFCVCTIVSIMGYRLKLSFDGYSNAYDFWVNADSMDIFPPGWCAKTKRILQPPKGISANKFNWEAYLNKEKAIGAPKMLFTHLKSSSVVPHNPFKVGMHLEAEDLNDTGKLCVATIADVFDDRIRIHFDGWDDCYDIIEDINSPYIHPCGWHKGRQQLVVPPDYEYSEFNWVDYIRLQRTGEAANEEFFSPRKPMGFNINMRVEVVDPRNASLIRLASVVGVKGHRVKLHLDCWPSDYCFWMEDDSPDLHPVGWCSKTGHDLEPLPGYQIAKQKLGCSVDGCRGIGNAKNPFKNSHSNREGCPYSAENWRTVADKPPRVIYEHIVKFLPKQEKVTFAQEVPSLQSRLTKQRLMGNFQMLDNIKTRNVLNQQDKLPSNHSDNILGSLNIPQLKKCKVNETTSSKPLNSTSTSPSTSSTQQQISENNTLDINIEIAREYLLDYGPRFQQNFNLWQKNFYFDVDKIMKNPLTWSTAEVSAFVQIHLDCHKTAETFSNEDIDGEAFLNIQRKDLTEILDLKLGPSAKLYNCILQLRTLAVTKFNVPCKSFADKKKTNVEQKD